MLVRFNHIANAIGAKYSIWGRALHGRRQTVDQQFLDLILSDDAKEAMRFVGDSSSEKDSVSLREQIP